MRKGMAIIALLVVAASPSARLCATLPAKFFSGDVAEPVDDAGWSALAARFPHRVKQAPTAAAFPLQSPPATRREVRPGLDYVRVRNLASDIPIVEAAITTPALIIDLRYVRGNVDESLRLGALLARGPLELVITGGASAGTKSITPSGLRHPDQFTAILVNQLTSGPLEAVVVALQNANDVLLVGVKTPGDTATLIAAPGNAAWLLAAGEIKSANSASLLDTGVTPRLPVDIDDAADETAYLAFDNNTPLTTLLDAPVEKPRFDEEKLLLSRADTSLSLRATPSTATDGAAAKPADHRKTAAAPAAVEDRILQRAVDTIVALRALGKIPAPAASPATSAK